MTWLVMCADVSLQSGQGHKAGSRSGRHLHGVVSFAHDEQLQISRQLGAV